MANLTKKQHNVSEKYDLSKIYTFEEAIAILKDIKTVKFDASMDITVQLGIDPKKTDQVVRGTVVLPHGTGKDKKILVLCTPDKMKEAEEAGADYVGLDDYLEKIEAGSIDVDVIITMPEIMVRVARLGKILGPRGLMPNPKVGTVTSEIGKAVRSVKLGKIEYKADKYGTLSASIGRISFTSEKIESNAKELLHALVKAKPTSAKGTYLKSVKLSSTMSKALNINISHLVF